MIEIRSGHMEMVFPQVNTVIYRGAAAFQKMDGKFLLEGTTPDIRFVNFNLDRFPGLSLRGSPAEVGIDLDAQEGVVQGETELGGKNILINYRGMALRGDLRLDGKLRRFKFGEKEMDITGTSGVLTNVIMAVAGEGASLPAGWTGRATLEEGHLKLGEKPQIDAHLAGQLQDTSPFLALLRGPGSRLLRSVFADRDLAIRASVRARSGVAEINSVELTGDRLLLLARLRFEEDLPPRGILYLKRGIFSVGLETGGHDRTVKILNPRSWFEKHSFLQPPVP
jgi:hypothetical protein